MSDTATVWHPDEDIRNEDGSRHFRVITKADAEHEGLSWQEYQDRWGKAGWLKTEPKASKDAKAATEGP